MRKSYVQIDGVLYEKGSEPVSDGVMVIPDIEPFTDTTGKHISGRTAWRNHLRALGAEEMGHADIRQAEAAHAKRKAEREAKLAHATGAVRQVDAPVLEARAARPEIAARVLNRLEHRPTPSRKMLIRIALEEARRSRR